jgi:phage shock protein A
MQTPDQQRLQAWQAGVEQLSHQVTKLKGKITRLEHRSDALQASESSQKT